MPSVLCHTWPSRRFRSANSLKSSSNSAISKVGENTDSRMAPASAKQQRTCQSADLSATPAFASARAKHGIADAIQATLISNCDTLNCNYPPTCLDINHVQDTSCSGVTISRLHHFGWSVLKVQRYHFAGCMVDEGALIKAGLVSFSNHQITGKGVVEGELWQLLLCWIHGYAAVVTCRSSRLGRAATTRSSSVTVPSQSIQAAAGSSLWCCWRRRCCCCRYR